MGIRFGLCCFGGPEEIRTLDLSDANRTLSQLSYRPIFLQIFVKRKDLGTRSSKVFSLPGGDKRDRTADLLNAIQALSQLSYTPRYEEAGIQFYVDPAWSLCLR